jgi:hypothetical protein
VSAGRISMECADLSALLVGCDLSQPLLIYGAVKPAPTKSASSRRTPRSCSQVMSADDVQVMSHVTCGDKCQRPHGKRVIARDARAVPRIGG